VGISQLFKGTPRAVPDSLFDPLLVQSQRLLAPHNFSGSHFLVIIKIFHLVSLLEELVVDVIYVMVLGKSGVLLEPVGLVTHQ
jgi:hypothetical protein